MKYKLQDLIDIEKFQFLQDRLNSINPFPSAIIDNDGVVLTATAWQDVCMLFHRKHPDCLRDCLKSDQYILEHIQEANPGVSYICPRGMVDNALPIIINGVHYANYFTGQFFTHPPDLEFFRQQAKMFGFDEDAYLAAVKKVPVWNDEQLDNYLHFLQGLIGIITESGSKKLQELEAEEKFRISQKRSQTVLQQMLDAFWVVNQADTRIVEVNQAMCDMLGYARDELLSMSIAKIEALDSTEQIQQRVEKIMRDGSDFFDSRFRRKDGSLIEVEVSVNYMPEERQFYSFHRDVTKRKQAEIALRENEARLSAIIEASRDAIGVSKAGVHVLVNPAYLKLFGFDHTEELIGTPILNLISPECREDISLKIRKRMQNEHVPGFYETTALRKDQTSFLMEVNVAVYSLTNEVYTLVILRDISERKRSEVLIRNSLVEKETLLKELYHRTKNNMQVITSMLELQATYSENPVVITLFREMENRISTMALVHQMLYQTMDLSRVNLRQYIQELMNLLLNGYGMSEKRIQIELDIEEVLVAIDTAIPCGLVLNELITNAVKYAFPNGRPGTLRVGLRRVEPQVLELIFADNGVGVPPEFDFRQQGSLGMTTIVALAKHQMHGQVEFDGSAGVVWRFTFREDLYPLRV